MSSAKDERNDGSNLSEEIVATCTRNNEHEIIEEDWSQLSAWNEDSTFSKERFSYYDTTVFPLSPKSTTPANIPHLSMELCCMGALTPLDMMDLSNGDSDATGNRIWMGALLFIECMARPLNFIGTQNELSVLNHTKIQGLAALRQILFQNKEVIELGAGTGASLISIGMIGMNDDSVRPSRLLLTDNDSNVLSLCRMNCATNLKKGIEYNVDHLEWGREQIQKLAKKGNDRYYEEDSYDTVIATDVIYDLSSVPILFETASYLLKETGYFVLSHVPRASINCESNSIREALEKRILREATNHGFVPMPNQTSTIENVSCSLDIMALFDKEDYAIRPNNLMDLWGNGKEIIASAECDYEEMDSVGASLIIFVKKNQ